MGTHTVFMIPVKANYVRNFRQRAPRFAQLPEHRARSLQQCVCTQSSRRRNRETRSHQMQHKRVERVAHWKKNDAHTRTHTPNANDLHTNAIHRHHHSQSGGSGALFACECVRMCVYVCAVRFNMTVYVYACLSRVNIENRTGRL